MNMLLMVIGALVSIISLAIAAKTESFIVVLLCGLAFIIGGWVIIISCSFTHLRNNDKPNN